MSRSLVAPCSVPLVRQLHEWAERNGVLLFPRAYAFPTLTGTLSTATRSLQPDGAFVVVALVGLSFAIGNTRVSLDQLQSGGRKLVDGTLRLAAYISCLETDGIVAQYLPAPIGVLPGDQLLYTVTCEVAAEAFDNGGGNNYETTALGFALHDAASGAQLPDAKAKALMLKLLEELGELHFLGLSGAATAIDSSTSPSVPMTCEIIALQGMAPTNTTQSRLTLGLYEVVPAAFTAAQTLAAFRAPGLMLNKGTICRFRVSASGSVRAHVALAGRRMGD